MSKKKKITALVAAIVIIVGLIMLWPDSPDIPDQPIAPVTQKTSAQGRKIVVPRPMMDEEAPDQEMTDNIFVPATSHEEALAAAAYYSGEGIIRCILPADIGPIDLRRLNWAGRSGNILTLAATEPSGQTTLRSGEAPPRPRFPRRSDYDDEEAMTENSERPATWLQAIEEFSTAMNDYRQEWMQPIAIVEWQNAYPETVGDCTVIPAPKPIDIPVLVLDLDGNPLAGANLFARMGSENLTDANGRGSVEGWAGVKITIGSYMNFPDEEFRWIETKEVVPTENPSTVTIQLEEEVSDEATREANRESAREKWRETRLTVTEPLNMALEDDNLSSQAKEQIEVWVERVQQRRH